MKADPSPTLAPQASSKRTMRVSLSTLLAICLCMSAAVVLAYIFGVMQGRDHAARLRPHVVETQRPEVAPGAAERILQPEELHFVTVLRDGAQRKPAAPAKPVQPSQPSQPAAPAGTDAAAAGTVPPGTVPGATPVPAAGAPPGAAPGAAPAAQPAVPVRQSPMYDYVFQVAAFKDEESVDKIRQRLEGMGYRTRMQRDGRMYVVLIHLRGDEARAAEIPQVTEALHLGKPIVRNRKLVPQQQ